MPIPYWRELAPPRPTPCALSDLAAAAFVESATRARPCEGARRPPGKPQAARDRTGAGVTLSVFTLDEIDRLRAVGNRFLINLYDGGISLWERAEREVSYA